MSVLCCGYERDTPFCPMCGAKANEVPLLELLNYLRSTAASKRTAGEAYLAKNAEQLLELDLPDKTKQALEKRAERAKAKILKWDVRVEALEEVVEKEQ
jgi:hypothetical protein